LGHRAPPEKSYHEFEKGVKVPLGKPENTKHQVILLMKEVFINFFL